METVTHSQLSQCLKITQKISFYNISIASEASNIFILVQNIKAEVSAFFDNILYETFLGIFKRYGFSIVRNCLE